jgi:gliding motility-associated-like protein
MKNTYFFALLCWFASFVVAAQSTAHLHDHDHSHSDAPLLAGEPFAPLRAPHKEAQPLRFIENKKQWEEGVLYRAELPSGFLFLRGNALQYSLYSAEDLDRVHQLSHGGSVEKLSADSQQIRAHSFWVRFLGANPNPILKTGEKHPTAYHYFLGNDPTKWGTEAAAYDQIGYQALYPYIDLTLYLKNWQLKYDFVVKPKGDPAQIQMQYEYADKVALEEGNLVITTSIGKVTELKPYSYQIIEGKEVEVPSRFVLKRGNKVSFEFPKGYDKNYDLIIDPVLVFSTFSGSFSDNWGTTATYDAAGNLYAGGTAFGAGFPTTPGAFSINFSGAADVGILKYNPTGTTLLYATYLGGALPEVPHSLIVDNNNQLVILGTTGSSNFPALPSSYDNSFNGGVPSQQMNAYAFQQGTDIFIAKLNAAGSNLLGSTFFGGSNNDGQNVLGENLCYNYGDEFRGEVALDAQGNVYVASMTRSNNFPLQNASQTTFRGNQMGIVAKFSPNLNNLIWSTYIGGNGIDAAYSLKVGSNGSLYVAGGTTSVDFFPVSANAFQTVNAGFTDGFLARYDAGSGVLQSATFVGTQFYNQAYFVDLDQNNNPYILGQTRGPYPISPGRYGNPGSGIFIQRFRPDLTGSVWSTVVGSGRLTPDISPTAFMINSCGNIYLAGWGGDINNLPGYGGASSTQNLPTSTDAFRTQTDGSDFYMMILSTEALNLIFASYFGDFGGRGDHVDGGTCRFDKQTGTIYHSVCACGGSNFPTTPGVWSNTNNSNNCNNAAFKVNLGQLVAAFTTNPSPAQGCAPLTVNFINQSQNASSFTWNFAGLGTSTATNPTFTFTQPGTYTVTLTARNPALCDQEETVSRQIQVFEANFDVSDNQTICKGESVQLQASGSTSYQWFPATGLSNPNIANPIASPEQTTTYSVSLQNAGGCTDTLTVTVTVLPEIKPDFDINFLNPCDEFPTVQIVNNTQNANSYLWNFGNGQTSTAQNPPPFQYNAPGTYTITLTVTNTNCNQTKTVTKTITILPNNFTTSQDVSICYGQSVQLSATGGTAYQWTPAFGLSNPNIANPIASPLVTTTYTVRITGNNGCVEERQITVTVSPELIPDFDVELIAVCGEPTIVQILNNSVGATSYLWDFGNGVTSTQANPMNFSYDQIGTYTVTLTVGQGDCQRTLSKTVTITESGFDVQVPPAVCVGQQVRLFASGGVSYEWTPAAGLSNPNIATPTATLTETTTYSVTIIGLNNCRFDTTVTVEVFPEILADFDINYQGNCDEVPTLTLVNQSVGATNFLWELGNGQTSTLPNPPTYTLPQGGTYTITLRAWNENCADSTERTITVTPTGFNISPNQKICVGQSVQLQADGGSSYIWTPATGLSDPNDSNPIASPTETTTYSVRILGRDGCEKDTTVTVEVFPEIDANFTLTLSDPCDNNPAVTVQNNSVGATSFLWNFGNGTTFNGANPPTYTYTRPGTYTVTLIVSNDNCVDSLKKEVTIFNNEYSVAPDITICKGQSVALGARGGVSYEWSPAEGLSATNIANPTASPDQTTTYTVRITGASGCVVERTVTVTVLPELKVDFSVEITERCDRLPIVVITNNSAGATSYFWDFGNGDTSTAENPPPFSYDEEGRYVITLRVENSLCEDSLKIPLNIFIDSFDDFIQNVSISDNLSICNGDTAQLAATGGEIYLWQPATGLSDPTIANPLAAPTETTTYTVRIANKDGGCFVDSLVTITVVPKIVIDFEVLVSSDCGKPSEVKIVSRNAGLDAFIWDMGNGDTLRTRDLTEYVYNESGEFEITVSGSNGVCDKSQSVRIAVDNFLPPNVISPNGDGKNENFVINKGRSGWKLAIYDRWGKLVYESDDYQNDWGSQVEKSAMYYYLLTSPEGNTCKGWLHVLK